jgi:hypothetical protein
MHDSMPALAAHLARTRAIASRPAAACRHAVDWIATSMIEATAIAHSTSTVAKERRDGKEGVIGALKTSRAAGSI